MSDSRSDVPYALVVDDDQVLLMLASHILEKAGFRVRNACDGDEAIEVLKRYGESIALLFTDVQMPGSRNGFALARETANAWPHISIVVASGMLTPGTGDMPEGATFISKPFTAELIRATLIEILPEGQKPEPLKNVV